MTCVITVLACDVRADVPTTQSMLDVIVQNNEAAHRKLASVEYDFTRDIEDHYDVKRPPFVDHQTGHELLAVDGRRSVFITRTQRRMTVDGQLLPDSRGERRSIVNGHYSATWATDEPSSSALLYDHTSIKEMPIDAQNMVWTDARVPFDQPPFGAVREGIASLLHTASTKVKFLCEVSPPDERHPHRYVVDVSFAFHDQRRVERTIEFDADHDCLLCHEIIFGQGARHTYELVVAADRTADGISYPKRMVETCFDNSKTAPVGAILSRTETKLSNVIVSPTIEDDDDRFSLKALKLPDATELVRIELNGESTGFLMLHGEPIDRDAASKIGFDVAQMKYGQALDAADPKRRRSPEEATTQLAADIAVVDSRVTGFGTSVAIPHLALPAATGDAAPIKNRTIWIVVSATIAAFGFAIIMIRRRTRSRGGAA